jgi:serine/threonine protein kinase
VLPDGTSPYRGPTKPDGSPLTAREQFGFPQIKKHIGPWKLGVTVGRGGTCSVRRVIHNVTEQHAVAKIINIDTAEKVRARSLANLFARTENGGLTLAGRYAMPLALEREIVIMRLLKHRNVVQLYDVWENRNEM